MNCFAFLAEVSSCHHSCYFPPTSHTCSPAEPVAEALCLFQGILFWFSSFCSENGAWIEVMCWQEGRRDRRLHACGAGAGHLGCQQALPLRGCSYVGFLGMTLSVCKRPRLASLPTPLWFVLCGPAPLASPLYLGGAETRPMGMLGKYCRASYQKQNGVKFLPPPPPRLIE